MVAGWPALTQRCHPTVSNLTNGTLNQWAAQPTNQPCTVGLLSTPFPALIVPYPFGPFREVFPVPHGFQWFSSGIPVEFSGLPVDFQWKSTGLLNCHKHSKFIRLSSESPLNSTIFHWTFVPVLFQWTSSELQWNSSGVHWSSLEVH